MTEKRWAFMGGEGLLARVSGSLLPSDITYPELIYFYLLRMPPRHKARRALHL